MSQVTTIAVASVVGAVAGFAAGVLGVALTAREHAVVSATIVVSPGATQCVAQTFPATLLVGKKDVIQWTVTGTCEGVVLTEVELELVGTCQANGSKVSGGAPRLDELFEDGTALKGRKIKRAMKRADEGCFTYLVKHGTTVLQDPELEIVQY